jgi:hypothetical protein
MNKLSPLPVVVGSCLSPEIWVFSPGFRTEAQFERVRDIVSSEPFAFSCGSMIFEPEGIRTYKGPVVFTWYDRTGTLHGTRIGANGSVISDSKA